MNNNQTVIPSVKAKITWMNDDTSAPTPLLPSNYNPPPNDNEDLPSKENLQENQITQSEPAHYESQLNNNDNNIQQFRYIQPVKRGKYLMGQNPRELKVLSTLLIVIVGLDTLLLVLDGISQKFNPFILADDIAILTMAIVYLVHISYGKSTNHRAIGLITIIVCFVGFGVKLAGIILYKSKPDFVIPFFILTAARFITMLLCIPHTYNNYPRY